MSKTIEELADEALAETLTPGFAEMLKDKTNTKIFEILAGIASQKEGKGPMEFTILMGRKCYELGREEKGKEIFKKLSDAGSDHAVLIKPADKAD